MSPGREGLIAVIELGGKTGTELSSVWELLGVGVAKEAQK